MKMNEIATFLYAVVGIGAFLIGLVIGKIFF